MIAFYFLLGVIVGSFLNVCVYRLPLGQSILFPGSHCGTCKKPVRWHDNVPVLSYLILRGRCRDCGTCFSIQYPLLELLTGFLFALTFFRFGMEPRGIVYLLLGCALLTQAFIDGRHKIIPDWITLPGLLLGLILSTLFPEVHYENSHLSGAVQSLIGILVGGGILYLIGTVAEWVLKKEAMGGGDVKLLAMIGAFVGFRGVLWAMFLGSFSGALIGIFWQMRRKDAQIPFGPFLGLGAFLYVYFGAEIVAVYRHLLG